MSKSERLHNQGDKEQTITPELKLSMEIWASCERLLQEKGNTKIHYDEITLGFLLPVPLASLLLSLLSKDRLQDLIFYREFKSNTGDSRKADLSIISWGWNPTKSKMVEVALSGNNTWLRLGKGQEGAIMTMGGGSIPELHDIYPRVKYGTLPEGRKATVEELLRYQEKISQSSPIEHK